MTLTQQMTDSEAKAAVESALTAEMGDAAAHVATAVHGRVVSLYGEVENEQQRATTLAVAASAGADGRVIVDHLSCRMEWDAADDARLADAVAAALIEARIPAVSPLTADVRDGVVTLRGTVAWSFQRESACEAVAEVPGVKSTHNAVVVMSPPMPDEKQVAEHIAGVLTDNLRRDIASLEVHVEQRRVVLSGVVASDDVRREAVRAANAMPGVQHVDSFLVVATRHHDARSASWDC